MEPDLHLRAETLVRQWDLLVEERRETESSLLLFGRQAHLPVVLKVLRMHSDEWNVGKVLRAFDGKGTVRAVDEVEGAVLMERIVPGNPLEDLVLAGDDSKATDILARVIESMECATPPARCIRVEDWGTGFDRYLQSEDLLIPKDLVEQAQGLYVELCNSQGQRRLLHGDLHHGNVLFDDSRGWLAIDPKGVVGELEYEIGAALRNPIDRPELYASAGIVDRRMNQLAKGLRLDHGRALRWTFTQAVLSAIWFWEDGFDGEQMPGLLKLAGVLRADAM